MYIYTYSSKCDRAWETDHFVKISDFETLLPHCSEHFAQHYGGVQFTVAYTVPKLRESKYEH